jgi:periplasmic protein TonB
MWNRKARPSITVLLSSDPLARLGAAHIATRLRSALIASGGAHAALLALLLVWSRLLPTPHPDTPPQIEVLIGGGGAPTPSAPPTPDTPPSPPSPAATPTKSPPTPPTPSDQPTPPPPPPAPAAKPSPATPPPNPAQPQANSGDTRPMASILDPTQPIIHPATAATGNMPPTYPSDAVRLQQHGRVTLRLHVTADGQVARAEVATSSGFPQLDQAALSSIAAWRFHPAEQAGKPVPDVIEMAVEFRIP